MPLYTYLGKLLAIDNALATSSNCCCGGDVCFNIGQFSAQSYVSCIPPCDQTKYQWINLIAKNYCEYNCSSSITPFPEDPLPTGVVGTDCYGLCYGSPMHIILYELNPVTTLQLNLERIENQYYPSFAVDIDVAFMEQNYPQSSGWKYYYTEERYGYETKEYQCEVTNAPTTCNMSSADIRIWAVKSCPQTNLTELTTQVITLTDIYTQGSVELSPGAVCVYDERVCGTECVGLLGIANYLEAYCHDGCDTNPGNPFSST